MCIYIYTYIHIKPTAYICPKCPYMLINKLPMASRCLSWALRGRQNDSNNKRSKFVNKWLGLVNCTTLLLRAKNIHWNNPVEIHWTSDIPLESATEK